MAPRPKEQRRLIPTGVYDSGNVEPIFAADVFGSAQSSPSERFQQITGPSAGARRDKFFALVSVFIVLMTFLAIVNEVTDFSEEMVMCIFTRDNASDKATCLEKYWSMWWTGIVTWHDIHTIIAHWINVTDWTLQVLDNRTSEPLAQIRHRITCPR